jgi:hypothetical protein
MTLLPLKLKVEGIGPPLESPLNAHLSDGTEDDSVSVGVGDQSASVSCFLSSFVFIPLRWLFLLFFGGVLVCPWSAM